MDSLPQTFARAQALHQAGQLRQAEPLYRAVLEQLPAHVVAAHRLGMLLLQSHRADEAEPLLRASAGASGAPPEAAAHLGLALHQLGRYEDALHWLDRAAPGPAGARLPHWRANTLVELGRFDEARAAFDRALALEPGMPEALRNRGILRLLQGDYAGGLADYEHRRPQDPAARATQGVDAPDWQGEPLAGRRIAVTDATGLGDELQFCRYLPLLADLGAEVCFLGNPRLYRLLATLDPRVRLLAAPGDERFDVHCKLLSLPLRFGTRLDAVPAATPYLHAEPARVAHWRARLGEGGYRVGVCWKGSPRRTIDAGRSFPLAALAPLAAQDGVRLVSLQKGPGTEELDHLPEGMVVERLGEDFDAGPDAFVDTAAVMASLDLVISSCTSVPHLAGALARPTWVALKAVPEWRWGLGRADNPWYPGMRLFRQPRRGAWEPVFAAMADAVRAQRPGAGGN
jgi:Flp pilus assembly protein TadD